VSFRDDGDALLARVAALEAENARLRQEPAELEEPPPTEATASSQDGKELRAWNARFHARDRTPHSLTVQQRISWWRRGIVLLLYGVAIAIAIAIARRIL
jgi:hypothetical protein